MKSNIIIKVRSKDFVLFKNLSSPQVDELLKIFTLKECEKGEIVYSRTDFDKKIYFVLDGRVKLVQVDEKGEEVIKDVMCENDIFGKVSELPHTRYEYAEVLTPKALVYSIEGEDFLELMHQIPLLASNYLMLLANKMQKIETKYMLLSSGSAKSKLLYFFKEMALTDGTPTDHGFVLRNYLTQEEIANKIFISRQTITRLLKELRTEKKIRYTRTEIEISHDLIAL